MKHGLSDAHLQNSPAAQPSAALRLGWCDVREAGKTLFFQPASPPEARRGLGIVMMCLGQTSENDDVNSGRWQHPHQLVMGSETVAEVLLTSCTQREVGAYVRRRNEQACAQSESWGTEQRPTEPVGGVVRASRALRNLVTPVRRAGLKRRGPRSRVVVFFPSSHCRGMGRLEKQQLPRAASSGFRNKEK